MYKIVSYSVHAYEIVWMLLGLIKHYFLPKKQNKRTNEKLHMYDLNLGLIFF